VNLTRFKNLLVILSLILVSLTSANAQQAEVVDRVIAVVNDEIILESEVLQYVQDIVLRNRTAYKDPGKISELREQVMEELINQKILLAIAENDTNVIVEDRQVDQTLDSRINMVVQELGGEEQLEKYYGKPIRQIRREFRRQVRDNLMVERVRGMKMQGINISRQEVEAFYAEFEAELPMLPEEVRLSHILFNIEPSEEASKIAKDKADSLFTLLLTGSDFNQLAIEFSDDIGSAPKGGLLGTTQRGDLVPEYEEIAFGLDASEVSQPILSRFGYHIIRLNWRRGEKINTSHILLMLSATDEDEARIFETAGLVKDRIDNGEEFEDLARDKSADEETSAFGGDLGWFDLRNMPEEFRYVAENLEVGQVSDPFKSQLGIHILKKSDAKPERKIDLTEDWDRISQMALKMKQDEVYKEWVTEQRKEVFVEIFE